ncbi:DUF998 domain-containing protein [Leifsonia poae]|uniref:ABC transporter permease n=1 Tax=Leifsonia poae TaxID=110933 RepID=A0A9W6HBQ0_9MICO|nr:DUF998 domain-containing protein [Leifsonia poae]GLJ77170.1 ABC transporter permease [Leifsonia poae]
MQAQPSVAEIVRHPVASAESAESAALLVSAAVFIVAAVIGVITFWGMFLPISGPGSLGQFVAIWSGIAATVAFVTARALIGRSGAPALSASRRPNAMAADFPWYDVVAVAVAHGVIALLGWIGIADLLEKSFIGAQVYALSAALLAAVAIAASTYVAFLSAVSMTPTLLSLVLAVFLVVGSFASMLSASDPLWWQKNLSTLGLPDDVSSLAFNLTLIIAGVIVTAIAHYSTADLPARTPRELRGRSWVRGALTLIGILLACVGLFPLDRSLTIHNISASGMAIVFVTLALGIRSFIPTLPRVFAILSYTFVGVIVVLAAFFISGYYTLTAVELVAFLMIFSWLIIFMRNTRALGSNEPATEHHVAEEHAV